MDWGQLTSYWALHNKEIWSLTRSLRLSTFAKQMVSPNAKAPCRELAFQPLQSLLTVPVVMLRVHFRLLLKHSLSLSLGAYHLFAVTRELLCLSFTCLLLKVGWAACIKVAAHMLHFGLWNLALFASKEYYSTFSLVPLIIISNPQVTCRRK